MSTVWMLGLLVAPPPPSAAETAVLPFARSRSEFRAAYREALQGADPRKLPDPAVVVPQLAALYRELPRVEGLSHSERSRLKRGLELRLAGLRDRLQRSRSSRLQRGTATAGGAPVAELSGGGDAARAAELIALIQMTIAPDSWQVNGGRGSIGYFPLLHALVVRQTAEVHHQLGDTLQVLRKLQ